MFTKGLRVRWFKKKKKKSQRFETKIGLCREENSWACFE
jgi:hypothetical protein